MRIGAWKDSNSYYRKVAKGPLRKKLRESIFQIQLAVLERKGSSSTKTASLQPNRERRRLRRCR